MPFDLIPGNSGADVERVYSYSFETHVSPPGERPPRIRAIFDLPRQ
jgi:hypothetical protein